MPGWRKIPQTNCQAAAATSMFIEKPAMLKKYVISEQTRKRCQIVEIGPETLKSYRSLSTELFDYLAVPGKLDFGLFFRVGSELIEFMRPEETSAELLNTLKSAMTKEYENIGVYIQERDYPKFERVLKNVRQMKIKSLLEKEPHLDRNTLELFSDLSNASQMVVRGGVTKDVAGRIQISTNNLVDGLMDSTAAIGSLSRMVACDPTLYDHSASVAMIATVIAGKILKTQMSRDQVKLIAQCGLYHDMGKTCVPAHVLNKPGKFTPEEYEIMKTHTTLGHKELMATIAAGAPIDATVARVALEHHERFTGKGYPRGRKGRMEDDPDNGIHIATRIVTIADVYSALLMKRVYKPAYDATEAIRIMAGSYTDDYDPDIFLPFLKHVVDSLNYYTQKSHTKDRGRILVVEDGKLKIS